MHAIFVHKIGRILHGFGTVSKNKMNPASVSREPRHAVFEQRLNDVLCMFCNTLTVYLNVHCNVSALDRNRPENKVLQKHLVINEVHCQ